MISRKADELSSQCGYSFCPSTCLLDRGQHISYLDWILFRKRLRYTLEMTKWKSAAYMDTMQELIPFTAGDIVKLPMPVDLYEAYGSYHYGIFACIN